MLSQYVSKRETSSILMYLEIRKETEKLNILNLQSFQKAKIKRVCR